MDYARRIVVVQGKFANDAGRNTNILHKESNIRKRGHSMVSAEEWLPTTRCRTLECCVNSRRPTQLEVGKITIGESSWFNSKTLLD